MTHIEQAIKEAVDKGEYKPQNIGFTKGDTTLESICMDGEKVVINAYKEYYSPRWRYDQRRDGGFWIHYTQITSDPLFWQALGKARGWGDFLNETDGRPAWIDRWHRFIDHLASGKDAEGFFKNL